MKAKSLYLLLVCTSLLVFSTCKKDTDVNMDTFKIVKEVEKITVGTTTATITGMYDFSGRIDGIKVRVGTSEQLFGSDVYVAEVSGKSYSVNITGLRSGTKYHYRYEVDYGAKEDYLTDISEFTTQSESPTVKTLEVLALDSTTFRVKCEVVADGGSEVSERGICWNTYGDPTIDDETMQHATGGLGQYTIRLEHLALGKKYYVRAYAKSMSGVGFGEEMEFETTSTPGMPVSIALSCNPEVGGTVSGAGSYAAGTQCTVTATANPTYTFVNWTENGTQVASDAAYTFTVSVERNLVANFTKQTCVISAQVVPENSGSVEGAGGYNPGDVCTLTATAKTGYTFVNWTKNGNVVSTEAEYTFTVTESATYVAHFQTKSYTISVSSSPSNGGTVTGGGTVSYGQTCTVQATPAEGYIFANWTDDGDVVSTEANYTFTVTGNRSLVANFTAQVTLPIITTAEVISISLTTATGGGNVTASGGATVTERGICWSTSQNPTINENYATNGTGTGNYSVNMTGLTANTTYYVRAYAKNIAGTAYGNEVSFTTLSDVHEYVDLGLTSGTLWATCNVGADTPENYGDYFAWGETLSKDYYGWNNYQYCIGSSWLTKYCNNSSYGYNGFTDDLSILLPEDDAATTNWGTDWRMPTKEEWQELYENTTHIWTTQNGVYGRLFTALNGNSLFLPAAGRLSGSNHEVDFMGFYWSSSLDTSGSPFGAWSFDFVSNDYYMVGSGRYYGLSVRPVRSSR